MSHSAEYLAYIAGPSDLLGLCRGCHEAVHERNRARKTETIYEGTRHLFADLGLPVPPMPAGKKIPRAKKPKAKKKPTNRPDPNHGVKTGPKPQLHPERSPMERLFPPGKAGFMPKHLRTVRQVDGFMRTEEWTRDTWRP